MIKRLIDDFSNEIEKAILIRKTEEKFLELFSEGKITGTVHTCVGQEFTGVFVSKYLKTGDYILSNHRGHGHYIAYTDDLEGLIGELMGKTSGCCGGIGGSQHLYNSKGFLSNGIQGGMTPIGAGIGLAQKFLKEGKIVVTFIGDGTLGEGIIYETFNFCSLWSIPILFVLENNKYAQSTNIKQTFAGKIKDRIEGFAIKYFHTNTFDIEKLDKDIESAITYTRKNNKPAFIEIETNRLNSHSKGDDNRNKDEIEFYRNQDPLSSIISSNNSKVKELIEIANRKIDNIVTLAENNETLIEIDDYSASVIQKTVFVDNKVREKKRINERIYDALKYNMEKKNNVFLLGEDIEFKNEYTPEPYGGAFNVTRDLSELYPGRVRNTPISEAAITGIGNGLAIAGFRPVVEIMFGDFTTLIVDQILQHTSKFKRMYNGQINIPIIIRTPMGGRRGYGPTHSQSIERLFLGIPDLQIIALNHRIDPFLIYNKIFIDDKNPYLVIENKVLYTRSLKTYNEPGFQIKETNEEYPTIKISPIQNLPEITIFCYGGILEEVENAIISAFEEAEIFCEIISPVLISPINMYPILDSVKVTKKLLIVEEGPSFASLGSEIIAFLNENGTKLQKFDRISNNNIIPCSLEAEKNSLPDKLSIKDKIVQIFQELS